MITDSHGGGRQTSNETADKQPDKTVRKMPLAAICTDLDDSVFQLYQKLIYNECRIFLKPAKKPLLVNRLLKRLRQLGIRDFNTYYTYLTEGPNRASEMQQLINAITTNKTEFFREPRQWEFLKTHYWPELQKSKASQREYSIRIWSSACSSGEEPYSLAMHALEHLGRAQPWKIQILASDISEKVLSLARQGVYDAQRVANVPADYLQKYFIPQGDRYVVKPEVRRLVTFRNVNLKGTMPRFLQPLDIIFCRNVIIYFDRATQADLMHRFFSCLRIGGHLFLGHSESLSGICDQYRFVSASIYCREG